jgi:hypothetical protein
MLDNISNMHTLRITFEENGLSTVQENNITYQLHPLQLHSFFNSYGRSTGINPGSNRKISRRFIINSRATNR